MNWFEKLLCAINTYLYLWYLKKVVKRARMMKEVSFWANRLQEMQFGQIVIGKIQFIINITILLKVFDAPTWTYFVAFFVSAFLLWYVGRKMEKIGLRKYMFQAQFKNVKLGGE